MKQDTSKQPPPTNRGVKSASRGETERDTEVKPLTMTELCGLDSYDDLAAIGIEYTSSVDWLTVTTSEDRVWGDWISYYQAYLDEIPGTRVKLAEKRWKALGYEGFGLPGIRLGASHRNGYIAILSGSQADVLWRHFLPNARRVTRIDLAVTANVGFQVPDVPKVYYEHIRKVEKCGQDGAKRGRGRPRRVSLIVNNSGGQTLYIGSRKSSQYGRVYDKGVESKRAKEGFIWRYEVEVKKPLAEALARSIILSDKTRGQKMTGWVWDWFSSRGVLPLFPPKPALSVAKLETDLVGDDRKVRWLRSGVQPTVQYLISRGRGEDALRALGLFNSECIDCTLELVDKVKSELLDSTRGVQNE